MARQSTIPRPYLFPPFDISAEAVIVAGWLYEEWEIVQHGIDFHGGIDFDLPRFSPVRATAAGYAVATWDEYWLRHDDGSRRLHDGLPMTFGQGLTVQIWHGNGRYTQYAHLSRLAAELYPSFFYAPSETEDGDLLPAAILRAPVVDYRQRATALKVKAGQIIGWTGLTGCANGGVRSYDLWREGSAELLADAPYHPAYMLDHLHFVEFGRKRRGSRRALRRDPFGLYTTAPAYPSELKQWHLVRPGQQHAPLWLPLATVP